MLYRLEGTKKTTCDLKQAKLASLEEADWLELNLEQVLASRIQTVFSDDQLMVLAQERCLQEEADILALDVEGNLHIFELKKSEGRAENLLQVLRYGQKFGQMGFEELASIWNSYERKSSGVLAEAHQEAFELPRQFEPHKFNQKQTFIVVVAGVDQETLAAIDYWRGQGLPIRAITYHVYEIGDSYFLEFHGYSPSGDQYAALNTSCFVVNTDYSHDKEAYRRMLDGRVSAFWGRKTAVDGITRGSRVFLYHSRVGVIACGRAKTSVKTCEYQDGPDAEHYVEVDWTHAMSPDKNPSQQQHLAVAAWEINRHFNSGQRFRLTCFTIKDEVANFIEKRLKEKHQAAK